MRSGAAAGHVGFFHEAAIYDSDDELLGVVVAHLKEAVTAGEPAIASLPEEQATAVRSALNGATPAVTFLPGLTHKERPPAVIETLRSLLVDLVAGGAEQVRVVNTVPHPGLGAPWDGWCRYEAAINDVLGAIPVWGLCLYDRRITPEPVLADVERTHPRLATGGRHLPNNRYQPPAAFLRDLPPPPPDPLETEPPAVELQNPLPAASRHAVQDIAGHTGVTRDDVDHLIVATSEAVTNAIQHGEPPVTLRAWAATDRIVVTVSDHGHGPQYPYAGLIPHQQAGNGGLGLWLMNHLTVFTHSHDTDGFTVHLVAGNALPLHHRRDPRPNPSGGLPTDKHSPAPTRNDPSSPSGDSDEAAT
jgi:anti-sigma regulatory factor (Ser/Thr protein kinase)